jgi:hypothetical protein
VRGGGSLPDLPYKERNRPLTKILGFGRSEAVHARSHNQMMSRSLFRPALSAPVPLPAKDNGGLAPPVGMKNWSTAAT